MGIESCLHEFPTARSRLGGFGLLTVVCLFPMAALGNAATNHLSALPEPLLMPSLGPSLLRLTGAFGVVVGLFLGGVWLSRHWRRFTQRPGHTPDLRVLEMRPVGARQTLLVVGYRRERLLLASSPNGITLLTHLPAGESVEPEQAAPIDFSSALRQALGRGT